MPRRRRPLLYEEKVDRRLDRLSSSRGQANARPLRAVTGKTSRGPANSGLPVLFGYDVWLLPVSTALNLSYKPMPGSHHVYLNGIEQQEGVDWSESGGVLTVLGPMDARSGDLLECRYAHYGRSTLDVHGPFEDWYYAVTFLDTAHISDFGEVSETPASGGATGSDSMAVAMYATADAGPGQTAPYAPWWMIRETDVTENEVHDTAPTDGTGWGQYGEDITFAFGCGYVPWNPAGNTVKYEVGYDPVSTGSPGDWTVDTVTVLVFYVRKGGPPEVP